MTAESLKKSDREGTQREGVLPGGSPLHTACFLR